jgi:hypothetical protein
VDVSAGPGVTEARGILESGRRFGGALMRSRERLLRLGGRTESADPMGHATSGPAYPAGKV